MPTPTSTPNTATTTRPERSSRRTARKAPLGWLPWALLGLLGLIVAATLLVINAVDDDGPDGPAGDSSGQVNSGGSGLDGQDGDGKVAGTEAETEAESGTASAAPDAGAKADTGAAGGASLTANGEDLLAAGASGDLAARAGQAVTGTATVESVVSDEGFWVGSSAQDRVFVFLTPEARQSQGESGFRVTTGQTVELEGALTALQESPEVTEGVTSDEGADQLSSQGAYVRAKAVTLA